MLTSKRLAPAGVLAVVCLVLGVYLSRPLQPAFTAEPRLTCPDNLDLGEQFFNDAAFGRFTVTNTGGAALRLSSFTTSCSCAGVEVGAGGEAKRVESLIVPPVDSVELATRISVNATVGGPQAVAVSFQTNDSLAPRHEVRIAITRIKGGLCCVPRSAVFGELAPADRTAVRVLLYENGVANRGVDAARSSAPHRFTVRVAPLLPAETEADPALGKPFAAIEVTPNTARAGPLSGDIFVSTTGGRGEQGSISVTGEVVSGVEASPPSLILTGDGKRSGQFELAARPGSDFSAALESAPAGLTVRVERREVGRWAVGVEVSPVTGPTEVRRAEVCVRVKSPGAPDELVYLPVLCPQVKR